MIPKNFQYYKFCAYGFLKNLRFYKPFILLFFLEQGFSYLHIGILFSLREIFKIVFEVPTGVLADKYGRKLTMVAVFLSYIVSFLIFYFFPYFAAYVLAMFFFGMGEALRSGTHKSMIFKYLDINGIADKKVEYYGHTRSWSKRGSALSALFAAVIVFYSGSYRTIFLFTIIPYVAELFLMLSYPDELNKPEVKEKENKTLIDFFLFLKNAKARKGLLTSSLFDGFFKSLVDYLQPVLRTFAISLPIFVSLQSDQRTAVVIGMVYFFLYIMTSYASQNAYKVRHYFTNSQKGMNITYIMGVVAVALSGIGYKFGIEIVPVLMFILYHMLQNSRRPLAVSYIGDNIPDVSMATGLSVESQMKTFFIIIISPVIGFLADNFGVAYAFMGVAGIMAIAYIFAKFSREVN